MVDKTPPTSIPGGRALILRIHMDVVRDLFRILLEPLERVLDAVGGDLHHLETVLGEGPSARALGYGYNTQPYTREQGIHGAIH